MGINVELYYERYGPMVMRRCIKMLRNEQEALDAMQDAFVQLLLHEERLDEKNPSGLLLRIATNICLNKIRSSRRRPEDPDDALLMRIASAADVESRAEAASILEKLFGREKESSRAIAVMHLLEGMTLEEVAGEVGMSVSGVRKRLRTLAKHIQELEGV